MLRDLIVAWVSFSSWHCHMTKHITKNDSRIISFVYFAVTAVKSWHCFLTRMFYSALCLSFIDFGTDWNSTYVLLYCLFSLRKQSTHLQHFWCKKGAAVKEISGWKSDSVWVVFRVEWRPSLCQNVTMEQQENVRALIRRRHVNIMS